MKININRLQTITKKRYLEYIKLFPAIQEKKVKQYTTLILTFVAMSLFGIFAINPTITTVIELRRTLDDAKFVNDKLEEKITNLRTLEDKYDRLGQDLFIINAAVPQKPDVSLLLAQIQGVALDSHVTLTTLQTLEVQQASLAKVPSKNASFSFIAEVQGTYPQISKFLSLLVNYQRAITIEAVSITKHQEETNKLVLSVRGRGHFRK
ncbi:MAG: type 4a pilus biogenesis protein PilO [Candidatus Levybacteria bacterium]|nr:type 4a pilus biogenesis protein PilO [Candidatus Levybacteria bacterium]